MDLKINAHKVLCSLEFTNKIFFSFTSTDSSLLAFYCIFSCLTRQVFVEQFLLNMRHLKSKKVYISEKVFLKHFPSICSASTYQKAEKRSNPACSILPINQYISSKAFHLYPLQGQGLYIPVLIDLSQSRAMKFQESMLSQ